MASTSTAIAASLSGRSGANPPSSPTPVESPFSVSTAFSAWYVSVPQRSASVKLGAPTGASMYSWKSIELRACAPPFTTLSSGTGSRCAFAPPRYR